MLIIVSTKWKFLDVIHLDLELALALLEAAPGILHGVAPYVIGVYHYQVLLGDVRSVEDGHLLQKSLCAEQLLAFAFLVDELGESELLGLQPLWLSLDGDVPVLPLFDIEKILHHFVKTGHLLFRRLLGLLEELPHCLRALLDALLDAVSVQELSWYLDVLALRLDDDQGLLLFSDLLLISFPEVPGNADLFTSLKLEKFRTRTGVKVDVTNDVVPSGSKIGDHALVHYALLALLLESADKCLEVRAVVLFLNLVIDLVDLIENGFEGHEPGAVVDHEGTTGGVLVRTGLEATPNLHVHIW